MGTRGSDALGALRWGLGRYAWLFLGYLVAVTALVPAAALRAPTTYDAEALVIAQRLDMNLVALPRYAEAVFDNGQIARTIAAQYGDAGDFEDIVPLRSSLVAEQDSVVLRVIGHDSAPDTAAQLANLAAAAFVDELNRAGDGVGIFAVQSNAVPPAEPTDTLPGLPFLLPVALLAGIALGLAAVAVVLVARRPVLEPGDAEDATGVPVLGTVTLPRTHRGEFPSGADVVGIAPLCRRVMSLTTDAVIFVSTPRLSAARGQLAVAAASVLGRVCHVQFVAPSTLLEAASSLVDEPRPVDGHPDDTSVTWQEITIIDSADPLDLVEVSRAATTILLVPRGMPLKALRDAAAEHLGGGPAGLVLVRRSRRRPSRVDSVPEKATAPAADTGVLSGGESRDVPVTTVPAKN